MTLRARMMLRLMERLGGWVGRHSAIALSLVLFVVVLGVFWPALANGFIQFDDYFYVTGNTHVRRGLTWANVSWALGSLSDSNWHPLTWMSHMLDYQWYGLNPWGHHLTNVIWHGLNTVLVFLVVRKLSGATWRSFLVAALFGLHPLRVESVASVSERKDVLSVFFWLLTLWAYLRGLESQVPSLESQVPQVPSPESQVASSEPQVLSPESQVPTPHVSRFTHHASRFTFHVSRLLRRRLFWYALALAFFALGLMSKTMLVTLPCALLLLDWWPLKRWVPGCRGRLVMEKAPFLFLAGVASVLSYLAQQRGGRMEALGTLSLAARGANAVVSYVRYLGKLFWPARLCNFYPHPGHWPMGVVLGCGAVLLAITVAAFLLRRRQPLFLLGWLWYLGTLVPVIGLVQIGEQSMADRYVYIPSLGILVICVWAFAAFIQHLQNRNLDRNLDPIAAPNAAPDQNLNLSLPLPIAPPPARRILVSAIVKGFSVAVAGAVVLACAIRTRQQIHYWKDGVTLLSQILSVTHDNHVTQYYLGHLLAEQGRFAEACAHYKESLRIKPRQADAHNDYGYALLQIGRPDEAIIQFQKALELRPDFADTRNSLGAVLFEQGRLDEAIGQFREALKLRPDLMSARKNLDYALRVKARGAEIQKKPE